MKLSSLLALSSGILYAIAMICLDHIKTIISSQWIKFLFMFCTSILSQVLWLLPHGSVTLANIKISIILGILLYLGQECNIYGILVGETSISTQILGTK